MSDNTTATPTPDKCPFCNSAVYADEHGTRSYFCDSFLFPKGIHQSIRCLEKERDLLTERVKRLEQAGDLAIREAFCGRDDNANEIWNKAKEAKP